MASRSERKTVNLTVLNNPAHNRQHSGQQTGCSGCNHASAAAESVDNPQPQIENVQITPHLEADLLAHYLNPRINTADLARDYGLTLPQFFDWLNSPRIQQHLDQLAEASRTRAMRCAAMVQPDAVATLENILRSYNDAEANELTGKHVDRLNVRQRHRESARRAAWLLLKMTGAIPAHVRPARPRSDRADASGESELRNVPRPASSGAAPPDSANGTGASSNSGPQAGRTEPDPAASSQHAATPDAAGTSDPPEAASSDTTLPTPEPGFIKSERSALERREAEARNPAGCTADPPRNSENCARESPHCRAPPSRP